MARTNIDWREDDGALVTEAAILYPMMFAVMFFVVQFAMFLWADMIVEQAAQQGLREVVLAGPSASNKSAIAQAGVNDFLNNVRGGLSSTTIQFGSNSRSAAVRVIAEPVYVFPWMQSAFDFEVNARAYAEFEQFLNVNERG